MERIKDLNGIELGQGPRGEYHLFVTSITLQQGTMIPLQASHEIHTHRKVLDAWIEEQLAAQKAK